jgi:hypothetical protein
MIMIKSPYQTTSDPRHNHNKQATKTKREVKGEETGGLLEALETAKDCRRAR